MSRNKTILTARNAVQDSKEYRTIVFCRVRREPAMADQSHSELLDLWTHAMMNSADAAAILQACSLLNWAIKCTSRSPRSQAPAAITLRFMWKPGFGASHWYHTSSNCPQILYASNSSRQRPRLLQHNSTLYYEAFMTEPRVVKLTVFLGEAISCRTESCLATKQEDFILCGSEILQSNWKGNMPKLSFQKIIPFCQN